MQLEQQNKKAGERYLYGKSGPAGKRCSNRRVCAVSVLFSIVFSFFNVYIFMLQAYPDSKIRYLVLLWNFLILAAVTFIAVRALFLRLSSVGDFLFPSLEESPANDRRYFWLTVLVLLLFWLPVFLAYYPGIFAYDVGWQIPQYEKGYTTHHPLAHTLCLVFFYYIIGQKVLGNVTVGIALGVLLQMIIFALSIAFVHLFLYRLKLRKSVRYALIILTGTLPMFSVLSISLTKDVIFASFFGLMFTLLCCREKLEKYYNKAYRGLYVFSVAGCILFRNNGLYVIILALVGLVFISVRHKSYRTLLYKTAAGFILATALNLALSVGLHAGKGNAAEAFSVPIQQMSCAFREHASDMPPEDAVIVRGFLPHVDEYNPLCSDAVKQETAIKGNVRGFLSLYFRMGLRYPVSYLRGFCLLDAGYLGLSDTSFDRVYGVGNRSGLLLTGVNQGFDVVHTSRLKGLENLFESLYSDNAYHNVIGLDLLCKPAFYMWIIMLCTACAIVCRKRDAFIPLLFLLLLILTVTAGPCVIVRYALPYIICIPQLCALVLYRDLG